jgi:alanyl-tRNA synthetase
MVDVYAWARRFPPTRRLYEEDSYLREASSRVLGYVEDKGGRYYIVFSETVFHPKAGGQGSDTGLVVWEGSSFKVEKVLNVGGVVVHRGKLLEGGMPEAGARVRLVLDWEGRYRTMRLHTAGHILDHAVRVVYGRLVETLDAYHSPPVPYVVYNARAPTAGELREIEKVANEVASSDLPVKVVYVDKGDLEKVVLYAPNLSRLGEAGTYRVVIIEGVNAIPCTGTHVKRTGEVGMIVVKEAVDLNGKFKLVYDVA